ncbi:hypothetical protein [Priestia koreensis]|uniref:hypothetical protein n=1 Tax=Priestia koreensis TaxID=284581 RepID=UPI001F580AAF|nr:hypothetical protein [Priestia koreensis]MCM3004415.1 hypothetical protein [Priestia koreensis]UNL84630.1 hypothetical protein IE339_21400 [Priestia koreensis]
MNYYPTFYPSYPYYYPPYAQRSPAPSYPPVNTQQFQLSTQHQLELLQDASLLVNKLIKAPALLKQIKEAAQESKIATVKALLEKTGVKSHLDVVYNPDSIRILLSNKDPKIDYGHLAMAIQW